MADVDGQIVLGLNISDTTAKIRSDLDSILQGIGKKEIVLSARIENIKNDRITSQINDIQKRLSQSLTMRDVKFNVPISFLPQNHHSTAKIHLHQAHYMV